MKMDFGEQDGCRLLWLFALFGEVKEHADNQMGKIQSSFV